MKLALIAAIILALVMALFATQNAQHVQVTFLGWYYDAPMVIILILSFGAGVLATFLALLPGSVRKSIEIGKIRGQLADSAGKLAEMEKRPIVEARQDGEGVHRADANHRDC